MSIWTSLEPASATVDPGSTATVRLRLRNTGDVVDEYRFTPVGPVAPWTTVEPPTLRLYPGTTGTVQLTFAPPRTPDATAGPNPYAVQITPTEHPEATTVPEGNLTITPFTRIEAELVPPTCRGRFRGRPKLAVDNLGNTKLTASIGGRDNGDQLSYDIRPGNVQIEPGRAAFVRAHLRPRQITWFGQKQTRPFTLAVRRSGHTPVDVDGIYIQRGVLPRWLATLLSLATALLVTCIALWFAYAPAVKSEATDLTPEAASSPLPTPPLSSAPAAAPAPAPAAPPQQAPAGGGSSGGGSGGSGGSKPSGQPKPAQPGYQRVLLKNGTTGKCADIPGYGNGTSGGPVNQFPCNGTSADNQLWDLDVVYAGKGPGGKDLFQIRNVKDGYCMDLPNYGADAATTRVSEFTCAGKSEDNQLWWLEKRPTGLLWIRNYASNGLCLDVSGYASNGTDQADNAPLTIFNCSDNDDQGWEIVHP